MEIRDRQTQDAVADVATILAAADQRYQDRFYGYNNDPANTGYSSLSFSF